MLVNSNPATIMTDPEFASATYVEPLLPGPVTRIVEKERPDALLPTLGGQTALNLAMALHEDGTLERFGVELIGADSAAIRRAEDREEFRRTMTEAGLRIPWSMTVESLGEVETALADGRIALPAIVRPAFTLGGSGGDLLFGDQGNDTILGGEGGDSIYGDSRQGFPAATGGDDTLFGGPGNDSIRGDPGDDWLKGEDGSDGLDGGDGTDTCQTGELVVNCES